MDEPKVPPNIPDKYLPGIKVSEPHISEEHPYPHLDMTFEQGRLSGQLPLPFGKIHMPFTEGPCQPDFEP